MHPVSEKRRMRPHRRLGPRSQNACVSCKERKLKCDDRVPECGNCSRLSQTCLVEDPETKKRRPRNYVESLEVRLAALEDASKSSSSPPVPVPERSSECEAFIADRTVSHDTDLALQAGLLDVQTTQAEPQYLGSSSIFAFSNIVNSSLRGHLPRISKPLPGLARKAPTPSKSLLPDQEVAQALSRAYFENIQPQYPFLHEPTFRRWERELAQATTRKSEQMFFVHMVYSVGALLHPDYQHLAEQLYASAQLYSDVLSHDNLESVQALLCYCMYSLRSPVGPSIWKLVGLALRLCVELGYHRENTPFRPAADKLLLQIRKRAFWVAYGIESLVAIWLGRPMSLLLHDISAEFPLDVNDEDLSNVGLPHAQPTSMSNAIHVIRLRCIWARINHAMYSDNALKWENRGTHGPRIEEFRAELEQWLASAPPPMNRTHTLSIFATRAWYELNYSYTILHLYRTQLGEAGGSNVIFSDCIKASKQICTHYRRLYVGTQVRHTWATLRCIFFTGLVYLHCLWTAPGIRYTVPYDDVSKTCTDAMMVLVVIAQAWVEAAPYRDLFEVLSNRTMSMIVNSGNGNAESTLLPEGAEQETLTQWVADIANPGVSGEIEGLLGDFMNDFMSFDLPA